MTSTTASTRPTSDGWHGLRTARARTQGYGYAIEAVQIVLQTKGEEAPATSPANATSDAFRRKPVAVSYRARVANIGWQSHVENGTTAGTTGRGLSVEALNVTLTNQVLGGGIQTRVFVADSGWQGWTTGQVGTTGRSKQIEAVQICLTGEMAEQYDVYYRVHSAEVGWLGWAKNGESAGTRGYGYDAQALEVVVVAKGAAAPGSTSGAYTTKPLMPADQLAMLNRANNYASSTGWLLMADTTNCKVGVYRGGRGHWQQVYFWDCTPGAYATPTVIGEFTVTGKGYMFGHGYSCYYYTQFYGDYLFHSIKYYQGTFRVMDGRLGVHASLGCVRLALNNAKWIYDNIPYGTKVVTYR